MQLMNDHTVTSAKQSKMHWSATLTHLALLLAILALGSHQSAYADDQDNIDYRQLIMKQLDAEAAALGMMVSGQIPPDSLALEAKSIANAARAAKKAFEPRAAGGAAKPEVWSQWDDFSKRMEMFALKSEEMAKVAESGDVAKVKELIVAALPCKDCHDAYRIKKR